MASHHHRRARAGLIALLTFAFASPAKAIRPFVTDDAHTVGQGHIQLETYLRRDRRSLQQWFLPAVGPTEWLELTIGGVHGLANLRQRPEAPQYSISGPLLQGKFLLHPTVPNRLPGVGVVVGGLPPVGRGGFESPGWSSFSYVAVTQGFFKEDDLLIHMNVGISTLAAAGYDPAKVTWGVGMQVETLFDWHLIGEIYSGDPYAVGGGGAYQAGFRQIYNDHLQLDFTFGGGLWGETPTPPWVSSGIRIVSHKHW